MFFHPSDADASNIFKKFLRTFEGRRDTARRMLKAI
jgi:hypothetical protein